MTARELAALSPSADEEAWARERSRSDAHLLALLVSLKCFQRLGYFTRRDRVPVAVVDHQRRGLNLPTGIEPEPPKKAQMPRGGTGWLAKSSGSISRAHFP
ncbi:MAG: DUF4158 domain-containing protein [Actinomycetota bacterium]|nr:DUF4158 domain-containing protein [Actinomycetota bacterium]